MTVSKVNSDNTVTPLDGYTYTKLASTQYSIAGLEQETEYEISVKSVAGSFSSEAGTKRATTITRPFSTYKVENVKATDITSNSFTASWDALEYAQTYNVSLLKKTYDGDIVATSYDFADKKNGMPEGWSANSSSFSTTEGTYGVAAPSLRFGTRGHYLQMTNRNALISKISFWMKPSKVSDASYIKVQRLVNDEWVDAQKVTLTESEGKVYTYDIDPALSVRLYFERTGTDYIYLDDVSVSGNKIKYNTVSVYTDKNVGNTQEFTFTDLEPQTTYLLIVRGENNGEKTLASDNLIVTTSAASSINSAVYDGTNIKEVYDLTGRQICNGIVPSGVYIIRENGKTIKVAK